MSRTKFVDRDFRVMVDRVGSEKVPPGDGNILVLMALRRWARRSSDSLGVETFLSPCGGTVEYPSSRVPSLIFKMATFDPSQLLQPFEHHRAAGSLLSFYRFSVIQAPQIFRYAHYLSNFLGQAAASMAKGEIGHVKMIVVIDTVGGTCWAQLTDHPQPWLWASASAREAVAKMHPTEGSGTCAICREEFSNGVRTTCGHDFHQGCLALWSDSSPTCPLCRNTLLHMKES